VSLFTASFFKCQINMVLTKFYDLA